MIIKALNIAAEAHRNQERKGTQLPYIIHPVSVCFMVAKYKTSKRAEELQVAALLHDVIEDTNLTFIDIATEFTPLVATLVQELTSDELEIKEIGKSAYLKKKMVAMSSYGLVLKLLDRLVNIMDRPSAKYVEDTKELLHHIEHNRKLTGTQRNIIEDLRMALSNSGF